MVRPHSARVGLSLVGTSYSGNLSDPCVNIMHFGYVIMLCILAWR